MTDSYALIDPRAHLTLTPAASALPAIVDAGGRPAWHAWQDFFSASIRNPHTRAAYRRAVIRFFKWLEPSGVSLQQITPATVGAYFDQHNGSPPTRKLHLAALRALFDLFVTRHIMAINPAASVRGEKYQVIEGKTPEITIDQATRLIKSIDTGSVVGLRDRAIIAVLVFTAARAGAVAKLRLQHFVYDGTQYTLRFDEKGGKSREIPVRHDLQGIILEYIRAAKLEKAAEESPLFRTTIRRTGKLTENPLSGVDICRLVKRRLKDAGLPGRLSPHSFRVCTVTDLLTQGVPLEDVQYLAGHSDPRTTRLYDRRQKRVTRNIVERISIRLDEPAPFGPHPSSPANRAAP